LRCSVFQHLINREPGRFRPWRIVFESGQKLPDDHLRRNQQEGPVKPPFHVVYSFMLGAFERIAVNIHKLRKTQEGEWLFSHCEPFGALLGKDHFPAV
jgi:hypothetical protein